MEQIKNCREDKLKAVATINRTSMAWFINALENQGIFLNDYKPEFKPFKDMQESIFYAPNSDDGVLVEHQHFGTATIENHRIEELYDNSIEKVFDHEFKGKLTKTAIQLADTIKEFHDIDLVFTHMPDNNPFFYDCCRDEETNFMARTTYGLSFGDDKMYFVFQFYVLFVPKMRKIQEAPNERWGIPE